MGVMGRGAVNGVAGPAVFTGAWIVSSLLQTGHRAVDLQISGLAAPDARDPWIMIAGFVLAQPLLAARFGRDREWRAWRPWLLASAGVTTVLLIAFAAGTSAPGAGFLQRAAVTIPLAVITAIATRLSRNPARLAGNRRRLVKTPGTGG